MHLIIGKGGHMQTSFYPKRIVLTRPDTLPHIFRKLRIHRNMTKRAMAAKFGVSEEYISKIENGSKFPSLKYCLSCSRAFGANPMWVKNKFAREAIERYKDRLNKRLGFEN